MSARSMAKAGVVLVGAWAFAAGPAVGQEHGRIKQIIPLTAPGLAQNLSVAKGGLENVAPRACVANTIACGQTRSGNLTPDDCVIESDNSFFDAWFFEGSVGQQVTINMTSSAVDAYLLLADPDTNIVAEDDNSGPGASDARLVFTLDVNGQWAIVANSRNGGETGPYSVSISCTGGGGGGTAPAAPSNLTGSVLSPTEVSLSWQDNSNNESAFRIESRIGNGAFVDIGSVPANSTGATIEQLSPNTTYGFRVRARNANGNSNYTNTVTLTTPGTGGGGFITTPEFPDFRFRIRINNQPARRENDCLPETLCVSGAVPGRSEVFVRIIGPRPNGFLWPNIIKFTQSPVEVEIHQISRNSTKTYILQGVDPSTNVLDGLFDRTGFQP